MDRTHRRYVRIWHFFAFLLSGWIKRKFNYTYDMSGMDEISGPVILIPNHVCAWDPLLVGIASRNRQLYFVMSEHMTRVPVFGKIIMALTGPILRRKASTDLEVVRNCLRHLKAGHSICLFAEGDQSWDGVTGRVFPSTGKLVKISGATLVTYRLEGAFLSLPRWASGVRRGRIYGQIAGIYTPGEIEKMSSEEIQDAIEKDLRFDIWEWQKSMGPVEFKGRKDNKDYAKGIDMLFFMCPGCKKIGTLKTDREEILCGCGFRAKYLRTGFLETLSSAADPSQCDFKELPQWDAWQREELEKRVERIMASGSDEVLFRDGPMILSRIETDRKETVVSKGEMLLSFKENRAVLSAGEESFILNEINNMSLILSKLMVFSYGEEYYQISTKGINIRKYLLVWEQLKGTSGV